MNYSITDSDNQQVFSREFENILQYYKKKQQRQNEFRNLVEMIEEIESSRGNELQFYQQQLSMLSKNSDDESNDMTSKYINEKEIALYNELQATQAVAAVQFDEMEMKLKNLLDEANQKWREANSSCNTLRSELIRTKTQMNQMNFILNSKQKECQDLQDKLCAMEAKFFKIHETNISDDITNLLKKDCYDHRGMPCEMNIGHKPSDVNIETSVQNKVNNLTKIENKGTTTSTYKPSDSIRHKETTSELDDFKVNNQKEVTNFKRKIKLPSLIQVSNATETKFIKKKRKLYNINDIGNLNEIQ
ncbi:uncharacterized protein LOC108742984 isoform X2 [Agrilus planipennis]|uniref:Uncharacterized protein LOC108742984 isoform X2 n=1 Tax=Agrilus planipennis TaxID=224129 RepID=A0A1W4XCZ2_AGRPL|nr:uncharacterized protein LOC108742984 isoform X2 [Agrilus planipennis]